MRNKCTTCRNYGKIISLTKICNGTMCIFLKELNHHTYYVEYLHTTKSSLYKIFPRKTN